MSIFSNVHKNHLRYFLKMQIWGIPLKPAKMELLGMKRNNFHFLRNFLIDSNS